MDKKMTNDTYTSAARDAGIHPGMQTLFQTHWTTAQERGGQHNKGGVRWHMPLHWHLEYRILIWKKKWACQLLDRSEQVYSNEHKLFSAILKMRTEKHYWNVLICGAQVSFDLFFKETAQHFFFFFFALPVRSEIKLDTSCVVTATRTVQLHSVKISSKFS